VGDFVLSAFSKTIMENIRQYDILVRYGGEEFVVILPETSAENALIVAEKLRSIIEQTPFQDSGGRYHVTASFGQASSTPAREDNFNKNTLINQADQALYEAKEKGVTGWWDISLKKKWFTF
jgi:diguanylate cyclase (GGDEF)-like protein